MSENYLPLSEHEITLDLNLHQISDTAHSKNISALAYAKQHTIIGSDEGATLWVASLNDELKLCLLPYTLELAPDNHEFDIEALHWIDNRLLVLGSHSLKRKKVKHSLSYAENRQRLLNVVEDKKRQQLWVIELPWFNQAPDENEPSSANKNPFAEYQVVYKKSLSKALKKDELLARFVNIPSKENGIDMEGIAADQDHIYIGFRSPVLRQNYVPVWVMPHSKKMTYELRFIECGGLGIRDLLCVSQGMLVLCGPSNDSHGKYAIYWWNKQDCIPGSDRPKNTLTRLATLETEEHIKAEAITLIKETSSHYHVLVAFDGADYGKPTLFIIPKNP